MHLDIADPKYTGFLKTTNQVFKNYEYELSNNGNKYNIELIYVAVNAYFTLEIHKNVLL